ncbi:MAG: DUF559 domain-containing protein [Candidatus Pristimantibacillus sp.]
MTSTEFIEQKEILLNIASALLEAEGSTKEKNIVDNCESYICSYDESGVDYYVLAFRVPYQQYKQMKPNLKQIELKIFEIITLYANEELHKFGAVEFIPLANIKKDEIITLNRNNQGRVRSDNPAPYEWEGLFFRSQLEINLYKAFKRCGVLQMPLPVLLQGGKEYFRIEPDFVILKEGITYIVELDGDATHAKRQKEDYEKDQMFKRQGFMVFRRRAQDCSTEEGAMKVARGILKRINEYRLSQSN